MTESQNLRDHRMGARVCLRNRSNRIWGYGALFVLIGIVLVADRSKNAVTVTSCNIWVLLGAPWLYLGVIRPRLLVDSGGLTVVNFVRTIRIDKADIAGIDSGFRTLRIARKNGKPPVNVWAVQTAQATRYLRRAGFSDHVAQVLDRALEADSFEELGPLATPEPLSAPLVLGSTAVVVIVSFAVRLLIAA